MAVEVYDPEAKRWYKAKDAFESRYDFDYTHATREILERLKDAQLLEASDTLYGSDHVGEQFRSMLTKDVKQIYDEWALRLGNDRSTLKRFRDSIPHEEWDYHGKVRPFEIHLMRWRAEDFKLSPEQRETIIEAVLNTRYEDDQDRPPFIRLERYPDDPPFRTDEPWQGRNYDLFAVLANVRNGFGFAGVDTGEPIEPIDEPRGVPRDCCPEWDEYVEGWGPDGHSHSWLTVQELMDYDWEKPKVQRGVVPGDLYDLWDKEGEFPGSHSGWVSGRGIVVFTPEGYEKWKELGKPPVYEPDMPWTMREKALDPDQVLDRSRARWNYTETTPYVQIEWIEKAIDTIGNFKDSIEAMKKLGPPDQVRLLMLFDN